MTMGLFILDDKGEPKEVHSSKEWGFWFGEADRVVALDIIKKITKKVTISTVFLGLDHSFGSGPPVLWETMIFGGKHDGYQNRYTSREAALLGHQEAVELVRRKKKKRR